jgi:hypothetical protein
MDRACFKCGIDVCVFQCVSAVEAWAFESLGEPVEVMPDPGAISTTGMRIFATGNWGCGVFGGDVKFKFLLQWIACSHIGRGIHYFPFSDPRIAHLDMFITELTSVEDGGVGVDVGSLYAWVQEYATTLRQQHSLMFHEKKYRADVFQFVKQKKLSIM